MLCLCKRHIEELAEVDYRHELLPIIKERLECSISELLFPNSKNAFMKQRQIDSFKTRVLG